MLKAIYLQPLLILILLATPLQIYQLDSYFTQLAPSKAHEISSFTSASPNFTLAVYPLAQTVYIGGKVTYSVSLTSLNSFAGQVLLQIKNLSSLLLLITSFNPNPVSLSANAVANSNITVDATNAGEENFSDFLVTASSGNLTSRVDVQITILAGGSPTPVSYAFLAGVLLFSAFIIWYGWRGRRLHQRREDIVEGPKPPPV